MYLQSFCVLCVSLYWLYYVCYLDHLFIQAALMLSTGHSLFNKEGSVHFGAVNLKPKVLGYKTERKIFASGIPYRYL